MFSSKLFRVDFAELWWMWLMYNPPQLVMGVRTQGTITGCWDSVGIVGKRSNSTPFLWSLEKIVNIVNAYYSIYPIMFITNTAVIVANVPNHLLSVRPCQVSPTSYAWRNLGLAYQMSFSFLHPSIWKTISSCSPQHLGVTLFLKNFVGVQLFTVLCCSLDIRFHKFLQYTMGIPPVPTPSQMNYYCSSQIH